MSAAFAADQRARNPSAQRPRSESAGWNLPLSRPGWPPTMS